MPSYAAPDDDNAVIGLEGDALPLQPGRLDAVEGSQQFPPGSRVQQRLGAMAGIELDEAVAHQQVLHVHGCLASSMACSIRMRTTPGVAPQSLISILAAGRPPTENMRSSTAAKICPLTLTEVL